MTASAKTRGWTRTWLPVALLLAAAGLYTWGTWRYFTTVVPGGNDFMAHYSVWEAYFRKGLNPYSDEAALYSQNAIRGRPALPGEDQNRLTYPFYSFIVHAPFIIFDYPLARALYMTLLQGALIAGVALTLHLHGWRPKPWLLAAVVVWTALHYPEARGIILGQFAIVGFAAVVGALYCLRADWDAAAGCLLVVATVKPTLVFLVIPFLLLWAAAQRRWRFVAAFAATLGGAMVLSWLMLPSWLGDWLARIGDYPSYTVGQSPVWLLAHQALPFLGAGGEVLITAALLGSLAWSWWRAARASERAAEFQWTLGWTLLVSALVVPRSATTNYVMLLLPTLWVLAALERRVRGGGWLVLAILVISLVGNWWLHFATVVGNQEQPILYVPWPLLLGLSLLAGRRWLMQGVRPPAMRQDAAAAVGTSA
jgi:hypothetical protein